MSKWNTDNAPPTPSKPGVKADLFLCVDLSDQYRLFTYVYEIREWTSNGDDTQMIKFWKKLDEIPGVINE